MLGFGISTAPGIYHNRMMGIVGDLYMNGCVVYIDDIIVYGKSEEEFLHRLDKVLSRLVQFNVRLKPSKCNFGYSEITFIQYGTKNIPKPVFPKYLLNEIMIGVGYAA
jgi:hypothetical protein